VECTPVGQSACWNSALQNSYNLTHGTPEKVKKCGYNYSVALGKYVSVSYRVDDECTSHSPASGQ